jgi:4-hydroxybenzoate polyprenyltransferase
MKVLLIGFFKLVRYPNLIIIVLTQYLFRYCILLPLMKVEGIDPVFSHWNFALLVLSTVLIAAAGYAINDYFDIRTDRINRPDKIVVGRLISRRKAMLIHVTFSIIAILLGIYLSYKVHSYRLASIHIIVAVLLWLYSLKYKAYFLVGNLIVSFVSALTIMIVWIFELYAFRVGDPSGLAKLMCNQFLWPYLKFLLWAYVAYAFITSLIREIIKDIEDVEGDKKTGCSTIPVVLGVNKTKYALLFLCFITIISLGYVDYIAFTKQLTLIFWYVLVLLVIPFIYMMYIILKAKNKTDYSFLSNITKFIMIAGTASMALIFPLF